MFAHRKPNPAYDRDLLREIVELGLRLLDARYGALGILNERGDALETFIPAGIDEKARAAIGAPPRGLGILGILIQDPRPIRLRDLRLDPRSAGFPPGHPPMRSFLGVPLLCEEKAGGNFYFTEKEGEEEFSAADEELAECLARLTVDYLQRNISRGEVSRSIDLLRGAREETTAAVCIVNPAREIIFWSAGAQRLFGFTAAEVLGQPFVRLLVPPEERKERRRNFDRKIRQKVLEGEIAQADCIRIHKDGRRIPVRMTVSPIRHRVAGIIAVTSVSRYEPL